MPLYDFECCGVKHPDVLCSRHAMPECPTCHRPMRRKVPTSNFALKGSGWAKDGYGKKS